jgi:hypothetical protein
VKSLFLPLLCVPMISWAGTTAVTCQLKDLSSCSDCDKRVPVTCEDHLFNGSLDWKTKVEKVTWMISNPQTGTEKIVSSESKAWHLKDFKNSQSWKALAQKQKIKISKNETVSVVEVQIPAASALFTNQSATTVVKMIPQNPGRAIASAGQDPIAGGVKRAQVRLNKK